MRLKSQFLKWFSPPPDKRNSPGGPSDGEAFEQKEIGRDTFLHPGGSYTVEAAVILPIVLFCCLFVFLLIRILMLQWGIAYSLDEAARNLALIESRTEEGNTAEVSQNKTDMPKVGPEEASALGVEGGDGLGSQSFGGTATAVLYANSLMKHYNVPLHYVRGNYLGLNYLDSTVTDNWIDLKVSYWVSVPFPILSRFDWRYTQQAKARRWSGYEPETDSYEDLMVYITPYGNAYHLSKSCPYLCPSIRAVARSAVAGERSEDGNRYYPCAKCGFFKSNYVFVTDYGEVYHTSLSCSGLKRTIRRVKLKEATGYHACPKCVANGGNQ